MALGGALLLSDPAGVDTPAGVGHGEQEALSGRRQASKGRGGGPGAATEASQSAIFCMSTRHAGEKTWNTEWQCRISLTPKNTARHLRPLSALGSISIRGLR